MSSSTRPDWATVPNAVTLLRLLLLVPVCVMIVGGADTLAVVLLMVWALTDWIDGFLARRLDQTSRVGAVMDPVADRLGLLGIVLSLALAGLLPWAALAILAAVDVMTVVLATRAAMGGKIGVSLLGKARTAVLMSSVFLLVAVAAWTPSAVGVVQLLVWIGVGLHVLAGIGYVVSVFRPAREDPAPAWRR